MPRIKIIPKKEKGEVFNNNYVKFGNICRYKIMVDQKTLKPDKFDYIVIKADEITNGDLVITKASRIDDCGFKDIKMEQGEEIKINYPNSAYIVFRSNSN
jgi:hypothetical protein